MSDVFKDAGYMTMTAGKWHLGMTHRRDLPINRSFDHTYGSLRAGPDYWTHGRGDMKDWARDGKTVFESGYMTDLFGNEICRLIRERDKSKPFFTYAAFTAPHTPLQAPQHYIDKYAHIENEARRIYCAMVEVLDDVIGNILQTVDDEGIRDNTIVMFFSDNGGSRQGADNGKLRAGKGSVYEGGTRLPAVIRWPGKIPAGVKTEQRIVVYDLFPTLVEAIGLPTRLNTPFDGESLWDVLQTGKARPRTSDMIIGNATSYAVHDGEFKLVHSNVNKHQTDVEETIELFKIYEDPYEETNVADQYPDVVKTMIAESAYAAEWVREAPEQSARRGRRGAGGPGGRGPGRGGPNAQGPQTTDAEGGARPGGGRGGPGGRGGRGGPPDAGPTPRDSDGNIIHLHESLPGD